MKQASLLDHAWLLFMLAPRVPLNKLNATWVYTYLNGRHWWFCCFQTTCHLFIQYTVWSTTWQLGSNIAQIPLNVIFFLLLISYKSFKRKEIRPGVSFRLGQILWGRGRDDARCFFKDYFVSRFTARKGIKRASVLFVRLLHKSLF